MQLALQEAQKAAQKQEVPVGAVLLDPEQNLIAKAHNQPIALNDPTAHAEILALRKGAEKTGNYRLTNCILISTLEPCIMCIGAMVQARISGLVFALADPKYGALISRLNFQKDFDWLNHKFWFKQGPLQEESRSLLQVFFKSKRENQRRGSKVRS